MDYEKKYKEALERANNIKRFSSNPLEIIRMGEIFPELEESEDERIRKAIHIYLDWLDGRKDYAPKGEYSIRDMIAWLEKQGKNHATIDIDKMVDDYASNKERGNEEFGYPVNCMIRAYRQGLNDAIGKVKQKPAWSEECNAKIKRLKDYIVKHKGFTEETMKMLDIINSLKPQSHWKPTKEQMDAFREIMLNVTKYKFDDFKLAESLYNDLKKL